LADEGKGRKRTKRPWHVHKETVRTNPGLPPREAFKPRCLSIDLEVGIKDQRIHRFAAIRGDTGESLVYRGGDLGTPLARLDAIAEGAAFVLGHNLIAFDLPHLAAVRPDLRLLGFIGWWNQVNNSNTPV
jgi:hypothetical protein